MKRTCKFCKHRNTGRSCSRCYAFFRQPKPPPPLFKTTAVLHPDGVLEVMGGALVHVRAEARKTPGARAIVMREVRPRKR